MVGLLWSVACDRLEVTIVTHAYVHNNVCVHVCVCACVRACVRACVMFHCTYYMNTVVYRFVCSLTSTCKLVLEVSFEAEFYSIMHVASYFTWLC